MKKIYYIIENIIGKILCSLGFHHWVYWDNEEYMESDYRIGCLRYGCEAE
jgi:hypothetical protein